MRHERISHLIHPLNTILDDSLGCALWFAARGQGILDGELYTSSARVSKFFLVVTSLKFLQNFEEIDDS